MKNIFIVLALCLFFISPNHSYGQCSGGSPFNNTPINLTNTNWLMAFDVWGGEYVQFSLVSGTVYEFSFCSTDGGYDGFDTEITILDNTNTNILAYNDDAPGCGVASKITFVAPYTGVFRVLISEYICTATITGSDLVYRMIPCTVPAVGGSAVTSRTTVTSNDSVRFTLTGHTGTIDWQYYFTSPPWLSSGSAVPNPNFFITSPNNEILYVRAIVRNGGCVDSSNILQINVRCATPFNDVCNWTLDYISNVTFNTINNNSTYNNNTAYQDFSHLSTNVCKGSIYNLSISSAGVSQGRTAWIDYNNDGDFDDPGENVMPPTAPSTLPATINVTIPGTAVSASVKMRVLSVAGISPNVLSCANTYYPTGTNFTDGGEYEEYTINISDIASSSAGPNQTICTSTALMAANAPGSGTGTWTVISGTGTFADLNLNNTNVTSVGQGSNVYRWTVATTACGTATSNVTILNNSPTAANAGPNQTVCVASALMAATPVTIGTGAWSVITGNGNFNNPASPTATVSAIDPGVNVFRWTTTNQGCTSTSDVTISFGPPSTSVAGSSQTICTDQTNMSANTPTVGTGTWSVVSGSALFADSNDPNTAVSGITPGLNTFRWTISNICGSSTSNVVIQNDGPTPAIAGADQTICNVDSTIMAANAPSVGTGVWTLESGTGVITDPLNPTTTITGLALGDNVFRWTTSRLSCTSISEVTIRVITASISASAGPPQNVCINSTVLAATEPAPGTGSWSVISGTAVFGNTSQATSNVTGLSLGTNVLRWTVSSGGCTDFDDVTIYVETPPSSISAGPNQNTCLQNAILTGSSPGSGIGLWQVVSGTGSFTNINDPDATVSGLSTGPNIIRWTVNNACGTASDELMITVGQFLSPYSAGPDVSVCTDTVILNATFPTAGTSLWSVSQGNGVFASPGNPNTQVVNLNPGKNYFVWTVFYGICVTSDTVIVDYLQPATIAWAGVDQQVCDPETQMAANIPVTGSGFWLVISGSANVQTPGDPFSLIQNIGFGQNVLRWYITNGTCYSSYDEVVVFRGTPPTTANAGNDILTCRSIEALNSNTPSIGTGMWSVVQGSVTLVNPHQSSAQVLNIIPGDSVILAWTITNGGCSSTDTMMIRTLMPGSAQFDYTMNGVHVNFNNLSSNAFGYEWYFGDGNSSQLVNPQHTYLAFGTYSVRLVAFNACINDTSYQVITIGNTQSDPSQANENLNLYPNPSASDVFFTLNTSPDETLKVILTDVLGRQIQMVSELISGNTFKISIADLPSGTYTLQVKSGNQLYSGKIIRK